MKRNRVLALALAFATTVSLLASCSSSKPATSTPTTSTPAAPEFVFKLSNDSPAIGPQADGYEYLASRIEELSNGRIQVDCYPAATLANKAANLEGLQLGTIELTGLSSSDMVAYDPLWDVFGLPFLFEDSVQGIKVCSEPEIRDVFAKSAEENGFIFLGWLDVGARDMFVHNRTINTVEDMKGVRVRVMGSPGLIACMQEFGADPLSMPWTDCYSAIQQGTIDAAENSTPVVVSAGLPELGGCYAFTQHFVIPDILLLSKAVYDALPADLQEVVLQAGRETSEWWLNTMWPAATEEYMEQLTAYEGVEVTHPDLTGFTKAAEGVTADLVSKFTPEQKAMYDTIMTVKEKF